MSKMVYPTQVAQSVIVTLLNIVGLTLMARQSSVNQ